MKKLICVFLVLITLFTVASIPVSATTSSSNAAISVSAAAPKSNDPTYAIRLAIVESLVEVTNARIIELVNREIAATKPNIDRLVAETNALARTTMFVASLLGIEVVCVYTPYEIHGVIVYIDPLIVIKR